MRALLSARAGFGHHAPYFLQASGVIPVMQTISSFSIERSLAMSIRTLRATFLLSTLASLLSFPAFGATTRTVTSTADTATSGTLRFAIDNSQPGDTIVFSNNLTYPATITLSNFDLAISH